MPLDQIVSPLVSPLVSHADIAEYRTGLGRFASGAWDEDRWKTFRLRFGIYAQRQSNAYMIRAKIPGGRLSFVQARAVADANRRFCGGDVHITTRQDFQFYFLELPATPAFLETLSEGGLTTREASGNTFRNVVACPLAGICPHELTDAGKVAESLSAAWIRHPLVQHMPRKFKTTVSGCGHDCGASAIDDLGFIATTQDGKPGFRVVAGGGLGNRPHTAIVVEEFIPGEDLTAVQEAFARLHHANSNRENKNASRVKFLVDRFGEDGFIAEFKKQFALIKKLPRPSLPDLDWRKPTADGPPPSVRDGEVAQHDGRVAVVVRPPLGMIDSARLEALTDIAEELKAEEFRLTRDQNIIAIGLTEVNRLAFKERVWALGFEAGEERNGLSNLVACPGTSTCTIGITDSNALARQIIEDSNGFSGLPETAIRISGCHNSCGQHHIGDFGLHALAKKINRKSAPHYQFHFGGDGTQAGAIANAGPVVPARMAKEALKTVMASYAEKREGNESVRDWAIRLGDEALDDLLRDFSLGCYDADDPDLQLDVGSDARFYPPLTASGECAAFAVVGEYLSDLAQTALLDIPRHLAVEDPMSATDAARRATGFAIQRLLLIVNADHKGLTFDELQDAFYDNFGANPHAVSALDTALQAIAADASLESAVLGWLVAATDLAETLIPGVHPISVPA